MLRITTTETINGWVGQVRVNWDDGKIQGTIVWESIPFSDDIFDRKERISAQDRAENAADLARNEAIKNLFDKVLDLN